MHDAHRLPANVRHPAHDVELEACGDLYRVRRSLGLARRLEQIAGPLWTLQASLRVAAVTIESLALLYEAALRDEPGAPDRQRIMAWIWDVGIHRPAGTMAAVAASLVIGNDQLRRLAGDRSAADADAEGGGDMDPTAPVRPSDGRTGSKS